MRCQHRYVVSLYQDGSPAEIKRCTLKKGHPPACSIGGADPRIGTPCDTMFLNPKTGEAESTVPWEREISEATTDKDNETAPPLGFKPNWRYL